MEKRYGRRIGLAALCWCAAAAVAAQSFRRVRSVDELEEGARYVLAGYCESTPDSVFVMCSQEATGLKEKNRASRKMKPDGEGRLHVTDGGTAIFELVRENASTYRLKDVALDAWLAYSTEKVWSSSTGLYSLTDEEFEKLKSSESLARTFEVKKGEKGSLWTDKLIEVPGETGRTQFCLLLDKTMDYASQNRKFKLFRKNQISGGDSLYIYKEVEPPALERVAGTDWTFRGDWTGDSLYALDYTAARRIDFTEISLPQAQGLADGGRLPEDDVWTYVRQGEAGRLPEGWPNVVEVGRKDGEVQGEAVTPIRGGDSCVWGAKYTFEVPEGTGISWCRTVGADGGWYTAGLPFALAYLFLGGADEGFVTIFDTGGGSTEFVFLRDGARLEALSVEAGAVTLTDEYFAKSPANPQTVCSVTALLIKKFTEAGVGREAGRVIGAGGNVTAMAAVAAGMAEYDRSKIHGSALTKAEVMRQVALYAQSTAEERRAIPGLSPKRADIILGGACIILAAMEAAKAEEITVSDRSLRHELLRRILCTLEA